jgi:hypothetical protein
MCPDLGTGFIVRLGVNKGVGTNAPAGRKGSSQRLNLEVRLLRPRTIAEILVIDKVSTPFESQAVAKPHLTQEPSVLLKTKVTPSDGGLSLQALCLRKAGSSEIKLVCVDNTVHTTCCISPSRLKGGG